MAEDLSKFSKNVHKSNIYNILLRCLGILLGLLSLKVNIAFLGSCLYGLWATIASVSTWANIGDFGISNGLRNELAKAIAEEDKQKQMNLIKTAEKMLACLSIGIFIVLSIVTEFLFFTDIMDALLRTPMYITNIFFCINFVLGISRTIAYSYQKSWLASLAQTSTITFQVSVIALLLFFNVTPNLVLFASIIGLFSLFGNLLIILLLLKQLEKSDIRLSNGLYCTSYRNSIFNVGLQFFVLQICCLILYSTDNVIINKLFDSSQVTKYAVITTVFNTGESLFSLLLISLWSAVTFVATKGDYHWIRKEIANLKKIWLFFCIGVVVVCLVFNDIVKVWLGDSSLYYEPKLLIIFGIYTIAMTFGAIYINVANGLGRIKLQMICSICGSIANIPLSIFLATTCGLGLSGIKLATMICLFGSIIVIPIEMTLLLKKKYAERKNVFSGNSQEN